MSAVRRAILFLTMMAFAALSSPDLHAENKAATSHVNDFLAKTLPSHLHLGGKQSCTATPIRCPDNYFPKCPPAVGAPTYRRRCACYDAKRPPCICPPKHGGTCAGYDAKCPPCVKLPGTFPSFDKCPPMACPVFPSANQQSGK